MEIELKVDAKYEETKIVIYAKEKNEEISNLIDNISSTNKKILKAKKDEKIYMLNIKEIEAVYSENGKICVRCNNELYTIKNRLYELEEILDKNFIRISNSEIVNFEKVENIDLKILGTLVINFRSGNKSYASRRYIKKIKEYLEI